MALYSEAVTNLLPFPLHLQESGIPTGVTWQPHSAAGTENVAQAHSFSANTSPLHLPLRETETETEGMCVVRSADS